MDPVSLAFIASLAAAAAVAELARPKTEEEKFHHAWGDAVSKCLQGPEELLVRMDKRQAEGELPEGYIELEDGRVIPERAYFPYVNTGYTPYRNDLSAFQRGSDVVRMSLDDEQDIDAFVTRYYLERFCGKEAWICQISGYDLHGEWRTLELAQPLRVRMGTTPRVEVLERISNVVVDVSFPVTLLDAAPSEILPIVGTEGQVELNPPRRMSYEWRRSTNGHPVGPEVRPWHQRPLQATGLRSFLIRPIDLEDDD